jgi:hypothetical protein
MKRLLIALVALSALAFAQHDHMHMTARPSGFDVHNDAAAHTLTVTLGPVSLPAHTSHEQADQMAPRMLEIPFDGWITAYHPSLVAPDGKPIPGRLLHHVAFWNTNRADFLCPNKDEHIFGAGGEMNDWPTLPGFGYRVHKGDKIRITTMFHNPTDTDYRRTLLRVEMEYASADANLKSVYPAWFDAKQCGESDFPLNANGTVQSGSFNLNYSGKLLGVGGHMHDYGKQLMLSVRTPSAAANQQPDVIASLLSKLDNDGHIVSMPVVTFYQGGGYPLVKGETVAVVGTYGEPRTPNADGMAIVVGYFLPDNDADLAGLARKSGGK